MNKKIFTVTFKESRKCRAHIAADTDDEAVEILYNGNLDESDIEVMWEDISEICDVIQTHG